MTSLLEKEIAILFREARVAPRIVSITVSVAWPCMLCAFSEDSLIAVEGSRVYLPS